MPFLPFFYEKLTTLTKIIPTFEHQTFIKSFIFKPKFKMKKYATLSFVFMAFVAFAQPKIHSITNFSVGNGKRKMVQLFDYQDNGLTIRKQILFYTRTDSTPRLIGEQWQRFSNKGQLLSEEERYWDNLIWPHRTKMENKFNADGCLLESRFADLDSNNMETNVVTHFFKRNAQCQILEDTLKSYCLPYPYKGTKLKECFIYVSKFEYDNHDSLIAVRDYNLSWVTLTFLDTTTRAAITYKRRADGKLIEVYGTSSTCNSCYPTRIFYEYNSKGQMIVEKNLNIKSDSTIFLYNQEGKLTNKIQFNISWTDRIIPESYFNYDYYCDGLFKSETREFNTSFGFFSGKTIYTYTEGPDCAKKDAFNFTISPNPVQWQAIISSEVLQSGNCTMIIYNMSGAVVRTYSINYRADKVDFSTIDLVAGTYFVRLSNDKNSVTKKLVVVH
jgi:Secretion system C-terminal sorting domain